MNTKPLFTYLWHELDVRAGETELLEIIDIVNTVTGNTWVKVADQLPPLDTIVWLAGEKWVQLGTRASIDDTWEWAYAYSTPYQSVDEIQADSELDDLTPLMWHPVPKPPFIE